MQPRNSRIGRFTGTAPLVALLVVGLAGCAPGAAPTEPSGAAARSASAGPKTLRVGLVVSEQPIGGILAQQEGSQGGPEHGYILHAGLTNYDEESRLLPQIAQKVPTVADGDWRVLPDGQMEVTWKLRPDVKWHDGVAATAGDFAFGLEVLRDPEVPFRRSGAVSLISEVVAPDASTLIVRWKQVYIEANVGRAISFPAFPRHLMGHLYEAGDKQAFFNSPLWSTQFVGLGPYRLGEWVEGSRLEAVAFDDYFLGRPKIDRLIIEYFGDSNVLVVNLLASAVDMTIFGAFGIAHLATIKDTWDRTGAGRTFSISSGSRNYQYQFRNGEAPWARDVRVRRALVHMLDRQVLADALMAGLVGPADTLVSPGDPVYRLVEQRGLARYSFDLGRAERLMADAGWSKGSGGTYQSSTGEPFTIDASFSGEPENVREAEAVAGQWRAAGLSAVTFSPMPDAATNKDELRHTFTGVIGRNTRIAIEGLAREFVTTETGTAANRWRGVNRAGYSNPEYDRLSDRILITLDTSQRQGLVADLLKLVGDEVPAFHVFYDPGQATSAVRNGIRGPGPGSPIQLIETWNVHEWEMD